MPLNYVCLLARGFSCKGCVAFGLCPYYRVEIKKRGKYFKAKK